MNLAPLRVYSTLSSYSSVLGLFSSRDFIMELLFFSRFSSKFLKSLFSPALFVSFFLKNLPNHLTKPIINENKPTLKFFWVHVKAIYVTSDYYFLKIN